VAGLTPARLRARRGEGDRLRGEILAVAEDLLIETADSSAVSIRAIADRVGVTPPSIYRHFADKDHLLAEVCEQVFVRLDGALEDAARDATDPVDELVRKGRAYVEFGLAFPEHYRLVLMRPELHHRPDGSTHIAVDPSDDADSPFAGPTMAQSNAFGHLLDTVDRVLNLRPDVDARPDRFALAVAVWTSVHGITSLRIAKPEFPWPSVEAHIDLVCGAWRDYLLAEH
jgi:AcrR family transcriptional regulator